MFSAGKIICKRDIHKREMAKDHAEAMTALGISKADVLGISQGGMIAQYLAIDYPDLVNKLILAVTSANQTSHLHKCLCTLKIQ